MKKYFLSLVAMAAAMLFATSCQESLVEPQLAGPTTFTVQLPDAMGTKAFGDEESTNQTINKLYVQVYDESGNNSLVKLEPISVKTAGTAAFEFSLDLVRGAKYDIILWAQNENAKYNVGSEGSDLRTILMTNQHHNSELGAAFYAIINNYDPENDADRKQDVVLTRPFAQLNIGTELTSDHGELTLVESKVTVAKAAGKLDRVAGEEYMVGTGNETTFTYTSSTDKLPTAEPLKVAGKDYAYVSMDYLAVLGDTKSLVDVIVEINLKDKFENPIRVERRIESVPVQMNYRTNIVGNLIATTADFEVIVDSDFAKDDAENQLPDYNVSVWDGASVTPPTSKPGTSGTEVEYEINEASDLAWLAAFVNGTLPTTKSAAELEQSLKGVTFVLNTDIDLAGNAWTPIGTRDHPFKGIFNGNGYTIKNLVVNGGSNANQGLFGFTTDGEIKNLIVENAKVSGRTGVGVVAGQPYTSKYTNITVKGHVEVRGLAYVGGVGGRNAYADWTNIKVDVDETSYVNADSRENGKAYRTYVGGVVGFNGEGGHSFTDITSNIDVKGSTCDVGGLFGIAHYGNNFVNCVCTGNVEIYEGDEDLTEEIGGIAGVWHNENGTTVTFTNCSFTGKLNTNVENVDLTDNLIVGAAYSEEGTGDLIINGQTVLAQGVARDSEGNYHISSAAGLRWVSENVNTMEYYVNKSANIFDEKTVYLAADIDLKGQEWRPIGDYAFSRTSFNGIFDGQNHTISNFKVTNKVIWSEKVTEASYGLFGNVKGIIKNVTVEDAIVNPDGGRFSGVLVGRLHDGGLIENCHVVNSSVTINHWQVGGILGQNNNGNIKNCSIIGSTVTGMAAVGAIVGMDMAKGEHSIENCCVQNTSLVQNDSFGESYDASYGLAVGLVNNSNIILHLNNIEVENNKIKGVENNTLVGDKASGATIYVNGADLVSTADELTAAINAGGSYIMMNDIAMTAANYQNIDIDFTLDGNGYTISQAEGSTNEYALFDNVTGKITLKNVNFAGIKGGAVLRTIGAETTIENVTIQGAQTTQQQGLLRLLGKSTIKNSTFMNNTCNMVISLNYDGANNDPQVVENCVFESNTCNTTAVLYYVKGAGATINGNRFIGNTVNCNNNGATVYMGFTEKNIVTNNLFQGNTVNEAGESSRVGGAIFFGYETVFTGNAFVGNKVTGTNVKGNDVCVSTYYTSIDLSGNYWGGNAPEENTNYFVQHKSDERVVIIDNYLTENPIK